MKKRKVVFFIVVWLLTPVVVAKSLGTIGTSFPIAEPDLLQAIETHVAQLKEQGKLDKLEADLNRDFEQAMDRPHPVAGLSTTQEPRTWLFDPSHQGR